MENMVAYLYLKMQDLGPSLISAWKLSFVPASGNQVAGFYVKWFLVLYFMLNDS